MDKKEFQENSDTLRKRKVELFKPIDKQIMMTDDNNEILLLAAAMTERAYSIFRDQYGRDPAIKLISTMIEIVDERDGDYDV